jgi:hypothetical protein
MNNTTPSGTKFDHLLWGAGGLLIGAWWVKNQADEAKKSQAEHDDPSGVARLCEELGPVLDEWEPESCNCEDDYTDDLYRYLCEEYIDDTDSSGDEIELRPTTREGVPDILIDDRLAIEVKVDPGKTERDRLVGQCAGYSREWVTWIVLLDTPANKVGALEQLLADKGLGHILVFSFS